MIGEDRNEQYEQLLIETLDEIWQAVDESSIPKFKAARYRTVDSEEIKELIDDFKNNIPAELRRANSVLNEANTIIENAETHANTLVSDAQKRADNISKKVEQDTQTMIDEANEYHDSKILESDKYYQTQTLNGDAYYNSKIEEAQMEAGRIVSEGVAERDRLVSEAEVVRAANETAEKIINEAKNKASELRRKTILKSNQVYTSAKESADRILDELMGYLKEYYENIDKDRGALGVRQYNAPAPVRQQENRPDTVREAKRANNKDYKNYDDNGDNNGDNGGNYEDEDGDEDEDEGAFRFLDIFKRKKKRDAEDEGNDYDDMTEE